MLSLCYALKPLQHLGILDFIGRPSLTRDLGAYGQSEPYQAGTIQDEICVNGCNCSCRFVHGVALDVNRQGRGRRKLIIVHRVPFSGIPAKI